ncbi:hypothetical protein STEG23_001158, partial [Scotinomys teguina]
MRKTRCSSYRFWILEEITGIYLPDNTFSIQSGVLNVNCVCCDMATLIHPGKRPEGSWKLNQIVHRHFGPSNEKPSQFLAYAFLMYMQTAHKKFWERQCPGAARLCSVVFPNLKTSRTAFKVWQKAAFEFQSSLH